MSKTFFCDMSNTKTSLKIPPHYIWYFMRRYILSIHRSVYGAVCLLIFHRFVNTGPTADYLGQTFVNSFISCKKNSKIGKVFKHWLRYLAIDHNKTWMELSNPQPILNKTLIQPQL